MGWNTLDDMDLAGKVVLTRVDINVPVENGVVTEATRIERIKPTIMDILAAGGKPVLLAHFGRPKGEYVPEISLRVTVSTLEKVLGHPVTFIERPDRATLDATPAGAVILIENTRFSAMEEANDLKMASFLASLGDVFCNDAFSAAHRAHASTTGVAELLPNCAGRLMAEELSALEKALGKKAIQELLPLQPGDVPDTYADVSLLQAQVGYTPATTVEEGVGKFVSWYFAHYE